MNNPCTENELKKKLTLSFAMEREREQYFVNGMGEGVRAA